MAARAPTGGEGGERLERQAEAEGKEGPAVPGPHFIHAIGFIRQQPGVAGGRRGLAGFQGQPTWEEHRGDDKSLSERWEHKARPKRGKERAEDPGG